MNKENCVTGADDAEECAMIREREAAGVSDSIETCPLHDDGGCPECERSNGPHYSGPCGH